MPLVTALSMIDTASFTRAGASADFVSTAVRAFLTAVRRAAMAARLRARFLIILRFCFSADLMFATNRLLGEGACNPVQEPCQALAAEGHLPREISQSAYGSTHGFCG